jgi:hypothetical protein
MDFQWEWIGHFGSLRERDYFVAWMQGQIANGMAEELEAPSNEPSDAGERWFRQIPTGSVWHLVSEIQTDRAFGLLMRMTRPRKTKTASRIKVCYQGDALPLLMAPSLGQSSMRRSSLK